uniref:Uncharacterized protein n=1 Tax=Physcomitrium patens TaxID=3218 RepID=A0A2K1L1X6_PHYPA|nr:hypothetical protein PHYPA_002827 [Physcomitrium patens]
MTGHCTSPAPHRTAFEALTGARAKPEELNRCRWLSNARLSGAGPEAVGTLTPRRRASGVCCHQTCRHWIPAEWTPDECVSHSQAVFSLHLPSPPARPPLHCEAARWSPHASVSGSGDTLAAMGGGELAAACNVVYLLLELCCLGCGGRVCSAAGVYNANTVVR